MTISPFFNIVSPGPMKNSSRETLFSSLRLLILTVSPERWKRSGCICGRSGGTDITPNGGHISDLNRAEGIYSISEGREFFSDQIGLLDRPVSDHCPDPQGPIILDLIESRNSLKGDKDTREHRLLLDHDNDIGSPCNERRLFAVLIEKGEGLLEGLGLR